METFPKHLVGIVTVIAVLVCLFIPLMIVLVADNARYRRGTDVPIQHAINMVHANQKSSVAHDLLAHAYMRESSYGMAALEYRKAIKYGPDFAGNHLWLAEALMKMNKIQEARRELLQAQSMSAEDDDDWKSAKAMLIRCDTLQQKIK